MGAPVAKELFLTGTYPALTWTTYLFVGLAIGRSDLRRRGVAVALLVGGTAVAVAAKLVSSALLGAAGGVDRLHASPPRHDFLVKDTGRWLREGLFGTTPTTDWRWLLISSPHSGTTFDLAHTSATSEFPSSASASWRCAICRWSYLPLAATGSMTYPLHRRTCWRWPTATDGGPVAASGWRTSRSPIAWRPSGDVDRPRPARVAGRGFRPRASARRVAPAS